MYPQAPSAPIAEAPSARPTTAWPGAFGIYKYSKSAVTPNVWVYLGIGVIYFIIAIVIGQFTISSDPHTAAPLGKQLVADVFRLVTYTLYAGAATYLWLAGTKGESLSFGQAISKCLTAFGRMLATLILSGLLGLVSLLALIVPFFFVYPRLVLAPYFLLDKNMGPVEAIKASWAQTKGHVTKLYGIYGAAFLMGLVAITLIGIPFAIYFTIMYSAANAVLYRYITGSPLVLAAYAPVAPQPMSPIQSMPPQVAGPQQPQPIYAQPVPVPTQPVAPQPVAPLAVGVPAQPFVTAQPPVVPPTPDQNNTSPWSPTV